MLACYKLQMTWRRWTRNQTSAFFNRRAKVTQTKPADYNFKKNKTRFIFIQCGIYIVAVFKPVVLLMREQYEHKVNVHEFTYVLDILREVKSTSVLDANVPWAIDCSVIGQIFFFNTSMCFVLPFFFEPLLLVFSIGDGHQHNLNKTK